MQQKGVHTGKDNIHYVTTGVVSLIVTERYSDFGDAITLTLQSSTVNSDDIIIITYFILLYTVIYYLSKRMTIIYKPV